MVVENEQSIKLTYSNLKMILRGTDPTDSATTPGNRLRQLKINNLVAISSDLQWRNPINN